MTRSRALKHAIRARAAKTGERYTTARRHVLNERTAASLPVKAATKPIEKASPKTSKPAAAKGGLSEAKAIEKTGHNLAHWFGVLDAFGAAEKGHTAAARYLYEEFGVPGWYCQGITVAYERERDLRTMNQRCDGKYEVSVSKVMAAPPARIIKALTDKRWTDGVDAGLLRALDAALHDRKTQGFVIRPDGLARMRYKWDGTTVQFYLQPKGPKTSFVVQHTDLKSADGVEQYRAKWKAAFSALAGSLT